MRDIYIKIMPGGDNLSILSKDYKQFEKAIVNLFIENLNHQQSKKVN